MTDYSQTDTEHIAQPLAPARYPLVRPYQKRIFAGVCRGLAMHLGMKTWVIRLIFVGLSLLMGIGIVAYLFLWITVPAYNEAQLHYTVLTAQQSALSRGNRTDFSGNLNEASNTYFAPSPPTTQSAPYMLSAPPYSFPSVGAAQQAPIGQGTAWNLIAIILAGVFVIYVGFNWIIDHKLLSPMLALEISLASLCALAVWVYSERFNRASIVVTSIALFIFIGGVFTITLFSFPKDAYLHIFGIFLIGIVSIAFIAAPLLTHYHQTLLEESAQKQREEERADMAAHLHDSVLQTLNLIRQNSQNPDYVAQLARTQERELRRWLYEDREDAMQSIVSSMKLISAQVEDTHGVPIEVITVGDTQPPAHATALIEATRQALTNACTHGKPAISLYVEANQQSIQVFVRDHGDGFNIDDIPEDRMGVRHSIQGRMERAGGTVEIVSRPHWGTEVRMTLPVEEKK
ncbi:PspC domain-containing protein [Alloscardovia omnicolens]|uniref:ATP-binding protein n=1 Tax=Alloscardovia omnicolens TaxID=419015 RepID=UPI003A6C207B